MITLIPNLQDKLYFQKLLAQGRLPKGTKITGDFLITPDYKPESYTDGSELNIDKNGMYYGINY